MSDTFAQWQAGRELAIVRMEMSDTFAQWQAGRELAGAKGGRDGDDSDAAY